MSTVKVTNLQNAGSSSVNMTLDTAGNATVANTLAMGSSFLRNRIINGDMRIDQRNAGAATTANDGNYKLDRWLYGVVGSGAFTVERSTTAPTGFTNSNLHTVTVADTSIAASDGYVFQQRIEGYNVADLGWGTASAQPITVSFWVRSSVTGLRAFAVRNAAGNRSYVTNYTINSANTWEQKTATIPGDTSGTWATDNTTGISLTFDLVSGSTYQTTANAWTAGNFWSTASVVNFMNTLSSTFYITGVQLEAGTVATPFERRQYGQELALCQRYYETCFAAGTAPAAAVATGRVRFLNMSATQTNDCTNNILFAVPKRATPTMTQYASTGNTVSASFDNFGTQGGNMFATLAANALSFSHWTASAEL